jgi:GT2 family glycosyltransferase/glycosyltransferase involved in cell wall biosynthesis
METSRKIANATLTLLRAIRLIYRAIPLPVQIRNALKAFAFKYFSWVRRLLIIKRIYPSWKNHGIGSPLTSIIIPVFGNIDITLNCLKSISENPQKSDFELIVVNDASRDSSKKWLEMIPGLRVVNNNQNLGFIQSCNTGANAAKGKYLHFLNNDTLVTPNWLDELVGTFDLFPKVGLVGSKLIYPDGKLQEAGAIVWKDGSAWNYGRGEDATRPEFNYARQVDYCSGASILIPKSLFDSLGGFDTHYLPAYYEDTDLAQRIIQKGLRVMYQPLSEVIHLEGATSGRDLSSGVKLHQVVNAEKFLSRWRSSLLGHGSNGIRPMDEKDRYSKKRVLFLDHIIPTPDKDAGSGVAFNTMLLLREFGFQVTFRAPTGPRQDPSYTQQLKRNGIEVLDEPHVRSLSEHLEVFGERYDMIIACRADVLKASLPIIRMYCPGKPVVFHTADLHFLRLEREAILTDDFEKVRQAAKYKELELYLIEKADLTIVHSKFESDLLVSLGVNIQKITVAPLLIEPKEVPSPYASRNGIMFVGGFGHSPNVDAIVHFCREVMTELYREAPEIILSIIGSNAPPQVTSLESKNVRVLGYVENVDQVFDETRVSIAPMRFGAGLKGKVARSMARGTPVIATAVSVEGMDLEPEVDYLSANSPKEFVAQILKIYNDETLWSQISAKSRKESERLWGFSAGSQHISELLKRLNIEVDPPKQRVKFV